MRQSVCGGQSRAALLESPVAVLQGAAHGKGNKHTKQSSRANSEIQACISGKLQKISGIA